MSGGLWGDQQFAPAHRRSSAATREASRAARERSVALHKKASAIQAAPPSLPAGITRPSWADS
eukprot:1127050-Amphidinium_carterae.1